MKKGLIAVLITANLLMLVIGIFTIPPNLPKLWGAAGNKPPAPGTKLAAPVDIIAGGRNSASHTGVGERDSVRHAAAGGRNSARGHGRRQYSRPGEDRRELIHGGTP